MTASVEISDLALLSNCQSAALVDGQGSLRWLCWPRFDSSPLFADLLDPRGGLWRLGPVGPRDSSRSYLPGSLVLRTTFRTPSGRAELTDFLALGSGERGHDLGRSSPQLLVRSFAVTEGTVSMDGCLMPRGQFGLLQPHWAQDGVDLRLEVDGQELLLRGPLPDHLLDGRAVWERPMVRGEAATFALGVPEAVRALELDDHADLLADTMSGWRSWSELHDSYRGSWRAEVQLSGRVLQGLTSASTGAVIAAPTTSLPRGPDGDLNRDYRVVVVEDAAATAAALLVVGCAVEAQRSATWLLAAMTGPETAAGAGATAVSAFPLPVRQADAVAEAAGRDDVGPVRLGLALWERGAHSCGELLAALQEVREELAPLTAQQQERLRRALHAEQVSSPAAGARGSVMNWVALEAGEVMSSWLGTPTAPAGSADRLAQTVRLQGWDAGTDSYTAFDQDAGVEAASLLLSLSGLVEAHEPAMMRTVEVVASALSAPCGLIYRDQRARQDEGPSLVCTFWLVRCLAAEGRLDRAEAIFEQATAYANDLGLLSEQADPNTGQLLGNFPYAGSHAGLVLAARDLQRSHVRLGALPPTG